MRVAERSCHKKALSIHIANRPGQYQRKGRSPYPLPVTNHACQQVAQKANRQDPESTQQQTYRSHRRGWSNAIPLFSIKCIRTQDWPSSKFITPLHMGLDPNLSGRVSVLLEMIPKAWRVPFRYSVMKILVQSNRTHYSAATGDILTFKRRYCNSF